MRFELWFYCFDVAYRLNMEQRQESREHCNMPRPQCQRTFLTVSAEWAVTLSCRMVAFYGLPFPNVVARTMLFVWRISVHRCTCTPI
jgi:hypothetical protein